MHGHVAALRAILIAIGVTSALLGALTCMLQRHIKRLRGFSRISLVGLLMGRVGLPEHRALAGVAVRGLAAVACANAVARTPAASLARSSTGN